MEFKQYIFQQGRKRMPLFSVNVTENDVFSVIRDRLGTIVVLKMFGSWLSYLIDDEGNMFTMDDHGNRDKASCFKFIQ